MKPKHTPGPWRFNSATMDVETLDGGTVAFPRTGGCLSGDFESKIRANARLIAAAPEMLEALCSIYCFAGLDELLKTKYSETTVQLIMKQMRDAIAKVKENRRLRMNHRAPRFKGLGVLNREF